jgi:Dcp1-like decapping family/mRNA-decapping enzyme C-terminus
MIITNRLNPTIFVQDVTTDVQFQFKKPYLMWKQKQSSDASSGGSSSEAISSIWFHNEDELKAIGKVLAQILKDSKGAAGATAAAATAAAPAPAVTAAAQRPAADLSISAAPSASSGGLTSSASSSNLTPSVQAFFNAFASATISGGSGTPASSSSAAPSGGAGSASTPAPSATATAAPISGGGGGASLPALAGLGEVSIMLTKRQLQTMLLDMVANDDEFISALHRKYLEALNRRASQE